MWTVYVKTFAAVCALMMTLAVPAAGRKILVPSEFTSIQAAIDAANDYDEIEVAPGTYNEAINFKGKAIRLYSSGGPGFTTIDGLGRISSVVTCNSGEDVGTILEGFTITGGDSYKGGGMYNEQSLPTVTDCRFTSNQTGDGGIGGTGWGKSYDTYGAGGKAGDGAAGITCQ